MGSTLWEKKNYLLDIPYLIATNIYEYDIRQANINVLYDIGVIDYEYYMKLSKLPKIERQIEIGLAIRNNKDLDVKLKDGITMYRKRFLEDNNIDDMDILSIKNDAIFLINKIPTVTKYNNVEFIQKNQYSSYMKVFGNLEVYFKSDMVNGNIILDVKGISDNNLKLHEEYMCTWLANTLFDLEVGDIEVVLKNIQDFYISYINRTLPLGYYRSFDSFSCYYLIYGLDRTFAIMNIEDKDVQFININTNLNVIRDVYKYASEIYFSRTRKVSRR